MPLYLAFASFWAKELEILHNKQIVAQVMKKCDACSAAFLELFLLSELLYFVLKYWYSVVGRSFMKASNVLPFWLLCGKH